MPVIFSERPRPQQFTYPALSLNRPTILLACILLLRLHTDYSDRLISSILLSSFPDMPLFPMDVGRIYDHTCVYRPRWAREMALVGNRGELFLGMLALLEARVLADVNLYPLAAGEGGIGGELGYLAALIGCEEWRTDGWRGD